MLIKKIILTITLFLLLFSQSVFAMPAFLPDQGVYVFETKSGNVVYSQNETQQYIPASTTKLMTSLVLLDNVNDLNEVITVGDEVNDYGWADSKAGLWQGEQLSYIQLLHALLIPSGNDAAGTIAINVGRKILNNPNADKQTATEAFVAKMNERAKKMGLQNTNFMNPSGANADNHYTSPEDMSKIAQEAFSKDVIKNVTSTLKYSLPKSGGGSYEIYNTDMNLYPTHTVSRATVGQNTSSGTSQAEVPNPYYTNLIQFGKTGTTIEGEKTFVFKSEQNGAEIIGVIFKNPSNEIFGQSKQVVEDLHNNYQLSQLGNSNNYHASALIDNVHFDNSGVLNFATDESVYLYTSTAEKNDYTLNIRWNNNLIKDSNETLELNKSIKEGDKVGALIISNNNKVLKTVPVYATDHLSIQDWSDNYYIDAAIVLSGIVLMSIPIFLYLRKRNIRFKQQKI